MNTATKKITQPLRPDKLNSTFYWTMKMDMSHSRNFVEEMTGYSKMQLHDEAKDKKQMLMRKIVMLHTNDYLNSTDEIKFYKRNGDFLNKKDCTMILILYKQTFEVNTDFTRFDPDFHTFLDKFYSCIREGKSVQNLIPAANASFSKDDYLDIHKQHGKIGNDELKLSNYCVRLISNGHSFTVAQYFFTKYKEHYIK